MKILLNLIIIAFLSTSVVYAEVEPKRTKYDRRTRIVNYNPYQVFTVKVHTGFVTMIAFGEDEVYEAEASGDPTAWEIAHKGRYLFLRAKADQASTNLFILTNKRQYNFNLKSYSGKIFKSSEVEHFAIHFRYPKEAAKRNYLADRQNKIKKELKRSTTNKINMNFISCGDKSVAPIAAYDNGIHTFLKFAPNTEIPAIYYDSLLLGETLSNYNVDNDWIRIHRVAKRFILRRGKQVGCLLNVSNQKEERTNTGTTSHKVKRVLRNGK